MAPEYTITQVRTPWLPTIVGYAHDWDQSVTFISEIESFCDQSNHFARPIYKSHEQRKEAFWRIPCGDMDRLRNAGRSRSRSLGPDVSEGFKLLKKKVSNLMKPNDRRNHGSILTRLLWVIFSKEDHLCLMRDTFDLHHRIPKWGM